MNKQEYWVVIQRAADNYIIKSAYHESIEKCKRFAEEYNGCKITIFDSQERKLESYEQMRLF